MLDEPGCEPFWREESRLLESRSVLIPAGSWFSLNFFSTPQEVRMCVKAEGGHKPLRFGVLSSLCACDQSGVV